MQNPMQNRGVRFAVGTSFGSGEYDICRAMQQADERIYRLPPEKDRRKRSRG